MLSAFNYEGLTTNYEGLTTNYEGLTTNYENIIVLIIYLKSITNELI